MQDLKKRREREASGSPTEPLQAARPTTSSGLRGPPRPQRPPKSTYEWFMETICSARVCIQKGRIFVGSPVKPHYMLMTFSSATGTALP